MLHICMFEYNSKLIIGIIYFLTFHYLDILTIFFFNILRLSFYLGLQPHSSFLDTYNVSFRLSVQGISLLKERIDHLADQKTV